MPNGGDQTEREQRQFRCRRCGGRAWLASTSTSECFKCDQEGERLSAGEFVELRQFCCKCDGSEDGHLWYGRAEKSVCRLCGEWVDAVPVGEEKGVFVCKFACDCKDCGCEDPKPYQYRVRCRMRDTAKCYRCRDNGHDEHHVAPYGFLPRKNVRRVTLNVHSCSRCNGSGDCPNFTGKINNNACS